MQILEAIKILKTYNNWRRGLDENGNEVDDILGKIPCPKETGQAIDAVIEYIELDIVMSNKNERH